MLKNLDKALAGAIDIVADDVTATIKSVREQGMARTLGDAVEDAGSLVLSGAGSLVGGILGGRKGEKDISNHSGVNSSYADLCAGRGMNGNFQGGGMSIPAYQPSAAKPGPGGRPGAAPAAKGGFGPGIGIQRQGGGPSPGAFSPGFNPLPGAGAPGPSPGAFHPTANRQSQQQFPQFPGQQAGYGGPQVPAYAGPGPAARGGYGGYGYGGGLPAAPPAPTGGYSSSGSTGGNFASPTAAKEPSMDPTILAQRFEEIRAKCPANRQCFDCDAPNPEWASVSFGILLCMNCSGHHRHMGTHISRVRSCKMDTWTERQQSIFTYGGNKRLADFFAANNAPTQTRYQRYHTPAAEWYREAWIKNKIFGKPVPPPDQGVVAGPCKSDDAPAEVKKAAAPVADLLDFDAEPSKPAAKAAAPAPAADLLGFDDAPSAPSAPKDSDLIGAGGGSAPSAPFDILGLASTAANARPNSSALSGLDFNATPAPVAPAAPAAPTAFTNTVPAQAAAPTYTAPAQDAGPMAGTLAGGAKYVEKKEEKEPDPFAMALEKWGM